MPTASAKPPSVMMLMVSPSAVSTASDVRIASGIDTRTIRVERHEPRNSRIIAPVSPAAMSASRTTSEIAPDTKTDWSKICVIFMSGGAAARMAGR